MGVGWRKEEMAQKTSGVCLELPLFCKGREFPLPEGEECCSKHFSKLMGFAFKSILIKPALQLLILWSQYLTLPCLAPHPSPSPSPRLIPWPSLSASPPAQTCSPLGTPRSHPGLLSVHILHNHNPHASLCQKAGKKWHRWTYSNQRSCQKPFDHFDVYFKKRQQLHIVEQQSSPA